MRYRAPGRAAVLLSTCLLAAGCGMQGTPLANQGITLLRYGQLEAFPAALVTGQLSLANGCVSLTDDEGRPVTALWPPDSRFASSTDATKLIIQGRTLTEGDPVSMGGGEYTDRAWVESLVGTIPESCQGDRYWLVHDFAGT